MEFIYEQRGFGEYDNWNVYFIDPVSKKKTYLGNAHKNLNMKYESYHIAPSLGLEFDTVEDFAKYKYKHLDSGCKNCNSHDIVLVEYSYNHPEHYDGASEIYCNTCGKRYGRFSGRELIGDDCERRDARFKNA